MLKQPEHIINTEEEYKQIESVKSLIENFHESGNFFQLSLKTLELIRRFNTLYLQVCEEENNSASLFNQLVITSKSLETELIRVI